MENQIQISAERQVILDAAKSEFFKEGGKIEVIETLRMYVPLPKRREPKLCAEEVRQRELAEKIRKFAPDMNRMEVSRAIGISYERVGHICRKFGIKTRISTGNNPNSHAPVRYDAAADPAMAEQIRVLYASGASKSKTARVMGIGVERLNRIADKYKITFEKKQ